MSRKYSHRGYQDDDRDEPRERRERPPRRDPDLPGSRLADRQRLIRHLRCHHCGRSLPLEEDVRGDVLPIPRSAECDGCNAPIHACRNCVHFDPAAAFECRRKVRPGYKKGEANDCSEFEPKVAVEMTRDDSRPEGSFHPSKRGESAPTNRSDARKAFDDLFK